MSYQKNRIQQSVNSTNIADLLERILDKGIVIVGDIKIKLVEVEFLSINIQLVVCSVDRAKEMGIDWWNHDHARLTHGSTTKAMANAAVAHNINNKAENAGNITANATTTNSRDEDLLTSIEKLNCRIASLEKQLANYNISQTDDADGNTDKKKQPINKADTT